MALVGTDRGTGTHNSATTTGGTVSFAPGSNLAAGSYGVLCIAMDNGSSSGNILTSQNTATDSNGVSWARIITALYDPASQNQGVELAMYAAYLPSGLTTAQSVSYTITVGSVSVVAKTWVFHEITSTTPGLTATLDINSPTPGTGANTATPSRTTGSLASGELLIGFGGAESPDTWAEDSDTTRGNWSSPHQHTGVGSGDTGMSITSQRKVLTGTGTQTYNPTLTAADCILALAAFVETSLPGGPTPHYNRRALTGGLINMRGA